MVTLSLTFISFHSLLGQFSQTLSIGSRGTVRTIGVGVYWDRNCENKTETINWGTIELESTKNVSIYLRNEGNAAVRLFILADNWHPPNASNYMSLSWDYTDETIDPQGVIQTTLTLSTSSDMEGIESFSFDIIIGVSG